MKCKHIFSGCVFIFICALSFSCSNTRNVKTERAIDSITVRKMVESPSFVFIPRNVNAVGVRNRDVGFGFQISVSKDTIVSYLPFFGRGYIAPLSPSDIDFDFTSTKFTNKTTTSRKGWIISIKPKDQRLLSELYFRIFDNASASLTITSNDRSSISYNGYILEKKPISNKK